MILRELMAYMETVAPQALAEEWDNVGLLIGDPEKEITTVVVALDADKATVRFAKEAGAEAIVSHHPIIFNPVCCITAPSALYELASSGIALFAAHTNLDAAAGGVNDALAAALGLQRVAAFGELGRAGELPEALSPAAFAAHVNKVLCTRVQWRDGGSPIKTVALVGGAGGDFIPGVTADAYVTGEVKHHEWLEIPEGLTVAVGGHYHTEVVVVKPLAEKLQAAFPSVRVIPFTGEAPYQTL